MTVHVDRSVRLPETEYFAEFQRKTGIALHHTVGGSARSTVEHWRQDRTASGSPRRVGTAYVVERDGTVFEVSRFCCAGSRGYCAKPTRGA